VKITPLEINGAYILEREEFKDKRGSFSRQFCKKELANYGLDFDIKQCNLSKNYNKGVLRGLHYQKEPYPEIKIVSCFTGAIYDVLVDMRTDSTTYLKWIATELTEEKCNMLYIPAGVAHGFLTLRENSTVYYQLGEFFVPDYYTGVRYNDPKLNIKWPACENIIINERDANYDLL
jgi:dTDP-4-dehydrorhamnose 3,5-epimerase